MRGSVVAVDVGGTNIRAALCGPDGKIVRREKRPTRDCADVLGCVAELVRTVSEGADVAGICVGIPGTVEHSSGVVQGAQNVPRLRGTNPKQYLEERFGVPVLVDNDARLAGVGEHRLGAGRGTLNMVYVTISTGIGGCAIVDGRPLRGADGFACEAGQQVFSDPERGFEAATLESLASGGAIAERAAEGLRRGRKSCLKGPDLTCEDVVRAAEAGDDLAGEVLRFVAFRIGLAVVNLVSLFNPEVVVLGGGVMNAGDLLLTPIRLTVEQYALRSSRNVRIVRSELGDDSGLLGAAASIIDLIEGAKA